MIETLEEFADRILGHGSRYRHGVELGHAPVLIDGQTRLLLMNLENGHHKFCFHNLGYGSEQWLVWKNPKWVGPVYAEIEKRIDAALKSFDPIITTTPPVSEIKSQETKEALIDLAQRSTSLILPEKSAQFDGLWFAKSNNAFYEIENDIAWELDVDGYRNIRDGLSVTSTRYIKEHQCWLDEKKRGESSTFQFLGQTYQWPKPKGCVRPIDPGNK